MAFAIWPQMQKCIWGIFISPFGRMDLTNDARPPEGRDSNYFMFKLRQPALRAGAFLT